MHEEGKRVGGGSFCIVRCYKELSRDVTVNKVIFATNSTQLDLKIIKIIIKGSKMKQNEIL